LGSLRKMDVKRRRLSKNIKKPRIVFQNLPTDVLQEVIQILPIRDQKNLRLVNSFIFDVVNKSWENQLPFTIVISPSINIQDLLDHLPSASFFYRIQILFSEDSPYWALPKLLKHFDYILQLHCTYPEDFSNWSIDNSLFKEICLALPESLEYIIMRHNRIDDTKLAILSPLLPTSLRYLDLSRNFITQCDSLIQHLERLNDLEHLLLHFNKLWQTPEKEWQQAVRIFMGLKKLKLVCLRCGQTLASMLTPLPETLKNIIVM